MIRTLLLALLLASPLILVAPSAAATDCDGDPMYWNPDYPTYQACQAALQWVECLTTHHNCPA
jgi:hypothetical protein